jgi:hypothetical protein
MVLLACTRPLSARKVHGPVLEPMTQLLTGSH